MKCRHTTIFNPKTGETREELTHDVSVEEHISMKLNHVAIMLRGKIKELDVNEFDEKKYYNNKKLLTSEKIKLVEQYIAMQQKHADIKKLIKSRTTHEELDDIAWSDFKKKFLFFFSTEY